MTAPERAQWAELVRDQAAAALAAGVVATVGIVTLDDAVAVWEALRRRMYPDAPERGRSP